MSKDWIFFLVNENDYGYTYLFQTSSKLVNIFKVHLGKLYLAIFLIYPDRNMIQYDQLHFCL